jgi:TorA maturation chaperone TorD
MNSYNVTSFTPLLFRFYTACLAYPYDEMVYELQHLYRELERLDLSSDEDWESAEIVLNIVNSFQGEELTDVRDEYVRLFGNLDGEHALCPLVASDFLAQLGRSIDIFDLEDLFWEAGMTVDSGDPADALPILLEYLALLTDSILAENGDEQEFEFFMNSYISTWVPHFCDRLNRASGLSFYKEAANGLRQFISNYTW